MVSPVIAAVIAVVAGVVAAAIAFFAGVSYIPRLVLIHQQISRHRSRGVIKDKLN